MEKQSKHLPFGEDGWGCKWLALAAFGAAVVFAGVGMALPPQGEIDSSVLILVAQLFVLCATFLGIKDINLPKN